MDITISNFYIDSFAGTVPRATYEYIKNHERKLEYYLEIGNWEGLEDIPAEHRFIQENHLREACNLWYKKGILLDVRTKVTITHETTEVFYPHRAIYQNSADEIQLSCQNIQLSDVKIKDSEAVFIGTVATLILEEKGQKDFFKAKIDNISVFEPNKLRIFYHDILGTKIIEKIEYDGKLITPIDQEVGTLSRYQKAWWYLPNGEIPYDIDRRFAFQPQGV